MIAVRDWGAFQRCAATVQRAAPTYSSNLYVGRKQVERWCAAGTLRASAANGAVLFLRADRNFDHVYHIAEDHAALKSALGGLTAGAYSADLVGQGEILDGICRVYGHAGFGHRRTLQRMRLLRSAELAETPDGVTIAGPADAIAVEAFMLRLLDPLVEQIPDALELRQEAEAGRLLLARQGDNIVGMLLYAFQGVTAHLRFWHVDRAAQGQRVGARLMTTFLRRCASAQRVILWVIADNERSVAIYRHYGFEADGLLDRIMVRFEEEQR